MDIELTRHAISQTFNRTNVKDYKNAKRYLRCIFTCMLNKDEWKWRKIKKKPSTNNTFILTDWKHKIVYKVIWPACYLIITYVKKTDRDNTERIFYKIFWRRGK